MENMKKKIKPLFASGCPLFLILLLHSTSISAQEVENQREFDYFEGSRKGPQNWGDLKEEWAACKNGGMQSPIDLSSQRVQVNSKLEELKTSYKPSNATVKNRGHDIAVQWLGDAGTVQINGTNYVLQQCHWHSPSEHTVNGKRYDLELHMVHTSLDPDEKNNIVVVGLFYMTGEPDAFLSKLTTHITSISDSKEERITGVIDPRDIRMSGNKYYSYMGSLTVPPCTEGVIWIISEEAMTVSKEQVNILRSAVHDYAEMNARPVQ